MLKQIDKLIALAEECDKEATSGPWVVRNHDVISIPKKVLVPYTREDNEFKAASRTAWPATARALKVALEVIERIHKGLEQRIATVPDSYAHEHLTKALAEIDRIAKEAMHEKQK